MMIRGRALDSRNVGGMNAVSVASLPDAEREHAEACLQALQCSRPMVDGCRWAWADDVTGALANFDNHRNPS